MKKVRVRFFERRGQRECDRAQCIWQVLIGYVVFGLDRSGKGKGIITYGDLAGFLGLEPSAGVTLGDPLGYIHMFCEQNDLPHLNAIVVRKDTVLPGCGIPGPGNLSSNREEHREEWERVLEYDWFRVPTPTAETLNNYRPLS